MNEYRHTESADTGEAAHLRRRAESAARWIGVMRIFSQLLIVLVALVLARLLQPEDYGLYAMVLVLVQFSFYVEGFKIEDAVVQKAEMDEAVLSSAYYFVLMVSAAFTVIFWMAIPAVTWFFGEPGLFWPMAAVSSIFLLRGSASVHRALLRRRLEVRTIALIQFGRIVPGAAVGVAAAALGYGMWSLVAYVLVKELAEAVAFRTVVRWRPSESFSWPAARRLVAFGGAASANEVVTYIQYHLPTYIIGRWLGAGVLGLFKFGFVLVSVIPAFVQHILQQALFPALSRAQDDRALVARAYLRSLFGVTAVTFLGAVLLSTLARDLIPVFLGLQWTELIPVVQVLAFLIPGMAYQSLFTASFHALGDPRRDLVLNVMLACLLAVGFAVGLRWGLAGIVWAYVAAFPVYIAVAQGRLNGVLGLSWRSVGAVIGAGASASLAAWGVISIVAGLQLIVASPPVVRIIVLSGAGSLVYAAALWLLARQDTVGLIRTALPSVRSSSA